MCQARHGKVSQREVGRKVGDFAPWIGLPLGKTRQGVQ